MDLNIHEGLNENGEKLQLFEESWFFGNLLDRKPRMLRSFSEPCTSSNYLSGKSYEETYESIKKFEESGKNRNLMRTPSLPLPPSLEKNNKEDHRDSSSSTKVKRKLKKKTSSTANNNLLLRTPSLPTSFEEFQDEETDFSMGKLIRQASMKKSDTLPPRTQSTKGVTPSSSITRHRSRTKQELEPIKMEGLEEIKPRRVTSKLRTQKSFNDLESEQLKGFKDMGFNFDKKELNPSMTSTSPGLQDRKKIEEIDESNVRRRPYQSEARRAHSSAPPVPKYGGKRSTDDVKAQIKFWARAVASNVRQEC